MAISRITAPANPPTADADWTQVLALLNALLLSNESPYRMDFTNGLLKKGAVFFVSGTAYLNDTDATPTGTASSYVKLTPSGDGSTLSASYVASLTGVTWSTTYNGWYDGGTPACLYIFDEHLAQASGAITLMRDNRNVNLLNHTKVNTGNLNTTTGTRSTASGVSNISSALQSQTYGYYNSATATGATAVGNSNAATGSSSSAVGSATTASGNYSFAGGYSTTADRNYEVLINGLSYNKFNSADTGDTVFQKLYALLGSNATARTLSVIGSYDIYALNTLTVVDANSITIGHSAGSKTAARSSGTAFGARMNIIMCAGASF